MIKKYLKQYPAATTAKKAQKHSNVRYSIKQSQYLKQVLLKNERKN